MDPKFRVLYLLLGTIGLVALGYVAFTTFPDINPIDILIISIPDLLFFFLAYKTYPIEEEEAVEKFIPSRRRSY